MNFEESNVVWECGGKKLALNKALLEKQGLTIEEIKQLIKLYNEKELLFNKMSVLNIKNTEDYDLLLSSANVWTALEFMIQETWHFQCDIKYHRFWELPHCRCPKLDNMDMWGTPHYIFANDCPIHGSNFSDIEEDLVE